MKGACRRRALAVLALALAMPVVGAFARARGTGPVPPRATSPRLVELNAANRAQLESVGGIGPALAASLLAARAERPFADWDDLIARVRGVGPASAKRLSAHGLRVGGQSWPAGDRDTRATGP